MVQPFVMTDEHQDSGEDPIRTEAQRLLDEIKQMRAQVEEQLKATEAIRKKSDDEASYANRAKISAEEHSKTLSIFKGTAEADLNSIATNKKNFEELVANVTVGKAAVEADIKQIADSRKAIEQSSSEIIDASQKGAARLQKIDEIKASVDSLLKETEQTRDTAVQARTKTDAAQKQAEQSSEQANALLVKINDAHTASAQHAAEVSGIFGSVKVDRDNLTQIIEHLKGSDSSAASYEARIAELSNKLAKLNEQAEGLLPGATSAGLAHSFNAQKSRFSVPQQRWLRTFVWCIVGLLLVAAPSFINAIIGVSTNTSWEVIFRGMALRLPIVIPLVWLAIYAGRNYMLSLRLEEDYAYKEAISRAFEGYKREMEKIAAGDAKNPTPLTKLCLNVLTAIAERPGRIYEGRQKDITLLNEISEAVEKAEELRKKNIAAS
jgi:hypothetical protein